MTQRQFSTAESLKLNLPFGSSLFPLDDRTKGVKLAFCSGCLLVEMATGEPLFPGKTDIDQLWLIMRVTGHLTRDQMQIVQANPDMAKIRLPPCQMRESMECRFPQLTYAQLEVVKV